MNTEYTVMENAENAMSGESDTNMSIMEAGEPERLVLYRSVMQEISRRITSSVSNDNLIEMFREIPTFRDKRSQINKYHDVLTKYLHTNLKHRIDEHIVGAELKRKFEILEDITRAHLDSIKTKAWRPTHDVESNLKSYVVADKLKFKEQLIRLVEKKEDAVNKLKCEVNTSRKRAEMISNELEAAEQRLKSICDEMGSVSVCDDQD